MDKIVLKLYYTKLNKVLRDETMRVDKRSAVYTYYRSRYALSFNMNCNGYVNF